MPPASVLLLDEAVPLACALVDSVAERVGVRALSIKGPALTLQQIRAQSQSVDVDVLVDPAQFSQLRTALLDLGWTDVEPYDLPTVMPRHSSTLRHPIWPCEIDLHHYFPGFLAEPSAVFDLLWQGRDAVGIAGRQIPCPSVEAHAMIAALHALRDARKTHAQAQLTALAQAVSDWPAHRYARLAELSVATGAEATLGPFLSALGLEVPVTTERPELAKWRLRSESETTASLAWWIDLRRASWRHKPARLKRAVWPSAEDMELFGASPAASRQELRQVRWARLRRGLRQVPRAIRESTRFSAREGSDG